MFLPATITLKFGDSGDFVTELQRRLVAVNCFSDGMVNGFFDGNTTNGVRTFQGMVGLTADGIAGPETLRRLNGVIAGDSTTSDAPKDDPKEDPTQTAASPSQGFVWGTPPTEANPFVVAASEVAATEIAAPKIEPVREPEQVRQELRAEPQHTPGGSDMLSGMVPPAMQQATQNAPPAFGAIQTNERPPLQPATPPGQQNNPAQQPGKQGAEQNAAPEQRPGLLSRAMQMANTMLQKLSDYFEAKLPPTVLNEVKQIGLEMARNGVKEIPIPAAPEARQAELPGRAQEPIKTR